jgi:prevent-host-death family protein
MTKSVSAARAKTQLAELVNKVAYCGEQYVIERRGKPMAALVSMDDLERLRQEQNTQPRPLGALALVGAWGDILSDEEIDQFIADVYADRERDTGRPVNLEE